MEFLQVSNGLSAPDNLNTNLSVMTLLALRVIVAAYADQVKHYGSVTICETLPPMQIDAARNKIDELLLMF
jgi:hypothetical protein